ncbi:MAG: sulfate reduction electron transfer complex DsrMKJOP subunit DsrM [Leptospirales bacterium]
MKIIFSVFVTLLLALVAFAGVEFLQLHFVFGVVIPYFAFLFFVFGFILRVIGWAKAPTPFNITTTAGQQKSLSWIKNENLENPRNSAGVFGRMFLEVFFFRSLFRNTTAYLNKRQNLGYGSEKTLWLGGLLFHWSFFFIFIRHLRFFTNPPLSFVGSMESIDGFMQVGVPVFYFTDLILLLTVTFLFLRRVYLPRIKYISLTADYFPLLLIFAIGVSGVAMRYIIRVDIMSIKTMTMSLVHFSPVVPAGIQSIVFVHLFLVCALFIYFPMSKLMHMAGVFLSPTRNLQGNSRENRHVNPWNYPVKVHPYDHYEDEFREPMKKAGIPVDKE